MILLLKGRNKEEYILLNFTTGDCSSWQRSILEAVQKRNNDDTSSWACRKQTDDEIIKYVSKKYKLLKVVKTEDEFVHEFAEYLI